LLESKPTKHTFRKYCGLTKNRLRTKTNSRTTLAGLHIPIFSSAHLRKNAELQCARSAARTSWLRPGAMRYVQAKAKIHRPAAELV
jgi:hypothetical protein